MLCGLLCSSPRGNQVDGSPRDPKYEYEYEYEYECECEYEYEYEYTYTCTYTARGTDAQIPAGQTPGQAGHHPTIPQKGLFISEP